MKIAWLAPVLAITAFASAQSAVKDRPVPASQPRPSQATVAQWQDRKFGMFIHFGLFSEFGGVYHGKQIDNGYSEQIMANAPIPVEEYAAAAQTFNPTKWDPDAIVALAKAAGMKYIVITSKHHDGFNMFATAQTRYNIVDATPYHRDIVKELSEACRRGGLAFGVYYSSIDWHQPGLDHYIEGNSNPLSDEHARFNAAQLRELLSHYGPISEIWFDMGKPTPEQSNLFATTVHKLQPQAMVSGRVWNYQGDFTVMGDNQVPEYGIDEPWQTPASIFGETWGYRSWQKRENVDGKIQENILKLVQVVSRGGNYILNIGPEGDGSVVPYEAEVLRGVGAWLKPNGEAIYGTRSSPFGNLDFGYVTVKDHNVYLFVKDATAPIILPRAARTNVLNVSVLQNHIPLKFETRGEDLVIKATPDQLSGYLPVIKLTTAQGLVVQHDIPQWAPHGALKLTSAEAEKYFNYNGRGYEAPATLYKMRWYLPAGCTHLTFHTEGQGTVALVADHKATAISLADGTERTVTVGEDGVLEITPPQPFVKGTQLALHIRSMDATTCASTGGSH
ncbi:alpha-L-fucosidase [Granulicella mallensis]|uniref:alpha-L-fucosidase n=1 Tax=Granulicella mallensis (strain ATCC BAA-1857 / DSM 23137 / MP5ACTX8) TaxID=682795 RepID=G8NNR0_GRAMM|nr:alpha-L-fucosidase [Granulicella mallensis]AEU35935.1 glycoside hydrolase family 29 (alpha-L-fucosidase) [Granulicella mallensis MP5ACTX8]